MQLADYIGERLAFLIPRIDPEGETEVILHGVEAGGVWIESQRLTNELMTQFRVAYAPRTLVFFVPYHEIAWAMASIEKSSLNETSFDARGQD